MKFNIQLNIYLLSQNSIQKHHFCFFVIIQIIIFTDFMFSQKFDWFIQLNNLKTYILKNVSFLILLFLVFDQVKMVMTGHKHL